MNQRIVVIGGGQNSEHDISLATAAAISSALRSIGHTVDDMTIGTDGIWRRYGEMLGGTPGASLAAAIALFERAHAVFPSVHGPLGEDGALAALCSLTHTAMVGSPLAAGALGMDKWATKLVAETNGILTAPGRCLPATIAADLAFESEVVVKPVVGGSSYGVSLARDAKQLTRALDLAGSFDDRILVEEVVTGREIDIAVLREADGTTWAAPPLEIHARGLFDTIQKYDGSAPFEVPAKLTDFELAELTEAALTMFDALGCAGVARIDFFLTPAGPVLNEVNTTPGMTADSQVPRMFAAAGVEYHDLVARMVAAARVPMSAALSAGAVRDAGGQRGTIREAGD